MQNRLAAPVVKPKAMAAPAELTALAVAPVTMKIAALGVPMPGTVKSCVGPPLVIAAARTMRILTPIHHA
jgi:hypothetical protein